MMMHIDSKTLAVKKNSKISGRIFIAHFLKINDLTGNIVSIRATLLQISERILSTTISCSKKMPPIIENF
jgi:hypothetical protein